MPLLKATGLTKVFRRGGLWGSAGSELKAVDDVSFVIGEGETLAIVGESGSGKSTTARLAMRLLDTDSGTITMMGEDITDLRGKALRQKRRHIQMVFQDPFASLNPRMKIVDTVGEGLRVHAPELSKVARRQKVIDMLEQCGMGAEALDRYPHQFSGGQRQRVGIARALVVSPKIMVLDEPVSALDVSVQAQVLNLLNDLQQRHGLSYLFISHDLSVVRHVADRVAVMFAGRIVEQGAVADIFLHPRHPYTKALLDARPVMHPSEREAEHEIAARDSEGVAASGCAYRLRCPHAREDCEAFAGALSGNSSGDAHAYACLHPVEG